MKMQTATFGAGCFWGVEEIFRKTKGVKETSVGYMGGTVRNPSYKDVCTDMTGHAEVVQIKFVSKEVSYDEILDVFWDCHNPTTLNRQGLDIGTQYRSVIFYHDEKQRLLALKSKEKLEKSGKYKREIVTEIVPASEFYMAEDYHQKYLMKRRLNVC